MKETGLLSTIPELDRNLIGVFNNSLEDGLKMMLNKLEDNESSFSPRKVIMKYRLDSPTLRQDWVEVLISELQLSFIPNSPAPIFDSAKKMMPKRMKKFVKLFLRLFVSKPFWK
jgi:hypothetical protein